VVRASLPPFLLLLGYGLAFAGAALGTSLLVYDDHPGQLYRLWHVLTRGFAPWAWNPGWWMGYPELQFYPPGFAYLGALAHRLALGLLPPEASYQLLVWIAYLAPGLTVFVLLARLCGGWPALPGAFVALTLSARIASGVEGGVHTGMLAARLGWALLPLVALAAIRWAEADRPFPLRISVLVALVALTHPAHLPTAGAVVLLAPLVASPPRARRWPEAAAGLGLGLALTAFWALPLVARLGEARPLAWGDLAESLAPARVLAQPLVLLLVLLAVLALRLAAGPGERLVAWLPWAMTVVVAADALLVEPLGLRWLPAHRVADGAWLAFVTAAGLGLGKIAMTTRPSMRRWAFALLAVLVLAALSLPGGTLTLWPRGPWPSYAATARGLGLDELWATLRTAPAGRVLFVRSAVPLVYGTEWYRPHSHITALAPLAAGREIVNGTFTHPSPVAAALYRGRLSPEPIDELVERLDGRSLFGRPLEALDAATFDALADRLGVSLLVVLDEDAPRLSRLDPAQTLTPLRAPRPFLVSARRAPVALPEPLEAGRWRVALRGAPGSWAPARIAYYPLWRAEAAGARLSTRRGPVGDLEVHLERGSATVDLVYAPGLPETAGLALSAVAALAGAVVAGSRRARGRRYGVAGTRTEARAAPEVSRIRT
jgi:hypothetical protein